MTAWGDCDGCLGDRQCWVCLGAGKLETANASQRPCGSCGGTGYCGYCNAKPDPRVQILYAADRV